jgi:HK97 family phage prohead protease
MPYSNYPQSATNAAKKALKHKEDNGSQCGTSVGWTRARQLSGREALSDDEVIRTYSFLSRAKVYDQGKYFDDNDNEICGSIMYDAWGGSTMLPWAERTANKIMDERSKEETMEKRSINYEFRAMPESRTIVGTATVFNSSYDMGWYDEEMTSDVFASADMNDVVALFNHDANMVLARTKSGTLKLNLTGNALEYSFEAPNTTLGNDLLEMVKRGDVYQSSFAFSVEKEDWQENMGGKPKRIIRSIKKVYDVSPVTYPANPDTMVAKRSYEEVHGKVEEDLQKVIDISVKSEINIQSELRRNALHLLNLKTK